MMKFTQILILLQLLINNYGYSQSDTNHLVIDFLEIDFLDSSETLEYVKFINETDTLIFTDLSNCKMVAINGRKTCQIYLKTNKTDFTFENINEYISFTDTKYRITIQIPFKHSNCIDAIYLQPDGMEMFHSQTMEHSKNQDNLKTCMYVTAGPTGYTRFEIFEYNFTLE